MWCYLNLPCSLQFVFCVPCNVQCILSSNFGKFHLICGLLSDVCNICYCGKDLMWFHDTRSKWWVDYSHCFLLQSMGLHWCFCHFIWIVILNNFLEYLFDTFHSEYISTCCCRDVGRTVFVISWFLFRWRLIEGYHLID